MNEKLKEYHLYSSQWAILYCLDQYGPMKQTDIWQYLNVEAPTTTRTLVKMERNNWVVRLEGKDKRERIVQLTDNAELLIPEIKESIQEIEQSLLINFDPDEIQQFHTLLKKIG